jgi:imidazoleglycerol-phosphate dehydratase
MQRTAEVVRETSETKVSVKLNLDGNGEAQINSGVKFLNHLLCTLSTHSLIDLKVNGEGDLKHHVVEDIAITIGEALWKALGDRKGIKRFGCACAPMDDTLATVAVDCGGRGYSVMRLKFSRSSIEDLPAEDFLHFIRSFAQNARINVHVNVPYGRNNHHIAEAVFKALALSLREAVSVDMRRLKKECERSL